MLDFKAFKTTNILLFIGICVSLFLLIPIQMKQSMIKKDVSETQSLNCVICKTDHTITNDQTKAWLTEMRELRESDQVAFLQIQLEEEQCVVPDELFASADKFSYNLLETVAYYLNESELYFVLEGHSGLTGEYNHIKALCSKFGMSVETVAHDETKQNKPKTVKRQLYQFLGGISAGCSFIILFMVELLWFQNRRKSWKIRSVFGVSAGSLIKEIVIVQLIMMFLAFISTLHSLKCLYHFEIFQMMKSSIIILITFVSIVLFWAIVLFQTSLSFHHK